MKDPPPLSPLRVPRIRRFGAFRCRRPSSRERTADASDRRTRRRACGHPRPWRAGGRGAVLRRGGGRGGRDRCGHTGPRAPVSRSSRCGRACSERPPRPPPHLHDVVRLRPKVGCAVPNPKLRAQRPARSDLRARAPSVASGGDPARQWRHDRTPQPPARAHAHAAQLLVAAASRFGRGGARARGTRAGRGSRGRAGRRNGRTWRLRLRRSNLRVTRPAGPTLGLPLFVCQQEG